MLVDSSTPLVDSRVEELVLWTQNPTLFEGQGLWIQTIVLHCSCAKAASVFKSIDYLDASLQGR